MVKYNAQSPEYGYRLVYRCKRGEYGIWKWLKFHITANCKITIANFLTTHCIANMIFHEQLNLKCMNYFKITPLAY